MPSGSPLVHVLRTYQRVRMTGGALRLMTQERVEVLKQFISAYEAASKVRFKYRHYTCGGVPFTFACMLGSRARSGFREGLQFPEAASHRALARRHLAARLHLQLLYPSERRCSSGDRRNVRAYELSGRCFTGIFELSIIWGQCLLFTQYAIIQINNIDRKREGMAKIRIRIDLEDKRIAAESREAAEEGAEVRAKPVSVLGATSWYLGSPKGRLTNSVECGRHESYESFHPRLFNFLLEAFGTEFDGHLSTAIPVSKPSR
jgi:hypothetical protein